MFSLSEHYFMTNNMKIVVNSIEDKLNESFFLEFRPIAIEAISKYILEIKKFEASGGIRKVGIKNDAEKFICNYHCNVIASITDLTVYEVFDTLWDVFSLYACGGLIELYLRQKNESWYPKIILTEALIPNDINFLDDSFTIYRGCDIGEFDSKIFGQAWTTSLDVAKDFAYTHYLGQDWFNAENRIILETEYSRNDVLFYSAKSSEDEVVVKVDKLGYVRKHI